MKVFKVIFGILAVVFAVSVVVTAMMFDGESLTGFWSAIGRMLMFGCLAALCILGCIYADEAQDAIEARKKLQEDLKENAPADQSKRA